MRVVKCHAYDSQTRTGKVDFELLEDMVMDDGSKCARGMRVLGTNADFLSEDTDFDCDSGVFEHEND